MRYTACSDNGHPVCGSRDESDRRETPTSVCVCACTYTLFQFARRFAPDRSPSITLSAYLAQHARSRKTHRRKIVPYSAIVFSADVSPAHAGITIAARQHVCVFRGVSYSEAPTRILPSFSGFWKFPPVCFRAFVSSSRDEYRRLLYPSWDKFRKRSTSRTN